MNGRTSDDIRREIERKRHEMDRTVDDLENKLSPGRMVDHAMWIMRGRDMGPGSDTIRRVGTKVGSSAADFAKDHPIPVALMSAGAAWLMAESRRPDTGPGTYARAEGRVGPYMGDAVDSGPLRDDAHSDDGMGAKAREKADDLRHRASETGIDLKHRASEKASGARAAVRDGAHSATERVHSVVDTAQERANSMTDSARQRMHALGKRGSEMAQRAGEQARQRGQQARTRYTSTLNENPLAIGAAAFGLGLAAGLSAPTTRVEDEYLGEPAETLKGEARSMARDAARAARSAGKAAVSTAKSEVSGHDVVDELKDRAKRVASDAAEAARDAAREEGLSAEQLRERARQAGERTRDSANLSMS